jgi:hypothetical protein
VWLRLVLLLPLLCTLHAERAFAASAPGAALSMPGFSIDALESAGAAERALCELAGVSLANAAGACRAEEGGETVLAVAEPGAPDEHGPAAPADPAARAAPMCDNTAASVAAVPEVPEIDRGRFEPAPCDIERLLALLRSDDRARSSHVIAGASGERPEPQPLSLEQGRFDAAGTGGQRWPVPAGPSMIALGMARGLGAHRGHRTRIERPPSYA